MTVANTANTEEGAVVSAEQLIARLPPRPDRALDPVLDATRECLLRRGVRHTTMSEIAKRARIARSTLYRHVSSVEEATLLVGIRELHNFAGERTDRLSGPRDVIDLLADFIAWVSEHVLFDQLRDERAVIGQLSFSSPENLEPMIAISAAPLEPLIEASVIRSHDSHALAEWIVRIALTLIVAPSRRDLHDLLERMLLPALEPQPA